MIVTLLAVSQFTWAQATQDTTTAVVQSQEAATIDATQGAKPQNNSNTNHVIVEVQDSNVVKQPTTTVIASPLDESRAERLRKQRQEYEIQTENKIVEKLEQSRLEDERNRAEKLFGDKQEVAPVVQPAVIQQMPVQQVVAPVVEEKSVTQDDLSAAKQEIITAIEAKKIEEPKPIAEAILVDKIQEKKAQHRTYMTSTVGLQDYMSAMNIESRGAAGLGIGRTFDDGMSIEGSFLYSNYFMDDLFWVTGTPIFRELDQWNLQMAGKYSFFKGSQFRPYVGGLASWTYRKYYDRVVYTWSGGYIPPENEATSWAFDVGVTAGFDFVFGENFAAGVEYRYSMNLFHRSESDILSRQYRPQGASLVEETDYSAFLINGKYRF